MFLYSPPLVPWVGDAPLPWPDRSPVRSLVHRLKWSKLPKCG